MNKSPMRRARERQGLTLEKIAIETGLAYTTVQGYESGRGAGYSVEGKAKIADFLKEPFFSLWPEEREKMRPAFMELKRRGVKKK